LFIKADECSVFNNWIMNPLLENALVGLLVGGAVLFFALKFRRKKNAEGGCDTGCGCGSAKKRAVPRSRPS
jgi:hypothetical protein